MPGKETPFDLIVLITAEKEPEEVAAALARMRPMCLAEPGCLAWEAYRSAADPARFTLVERWESEKAWEEHGEGDAIQRVYLPEILPRVQREVHPSAPV